MSFVFVIDTNKKPLEPIHPAQARQWLREKKAAVWRRYPFTIVLKAAVEFISQPQLRIKLDPGSKTTGLAIINDESGQVVFAAEIEHRGQVIKKAMDGRRGIRRSRRNRHTRYRQPRFNNRRNKKKGWLAPSINSRIENIITWVKRCMKVCPIGAISQELVKFDTQALQNPEIEGVGYQQGELMGYEVREYLLEKWKRRCAYCGKKDVPLQVEHIHPKAKGGTNRISNLTLACKPCNDAKGTKSVQEFLTKKPEVLKRILVQAKTPLKDAASVNSTRWALYTRLKEIGLPVETGSGGMTKWNRSNRKLEKQHWNDAVCVGASTPEKLLIKGIHPLCIKATGYGKRQMCQTDKYGFPKQHRQRKKVHFGFQTGDMVKAHIIKGKYAGRYMNRVTVRTSGQFKLGTKQGEIPCGYKYCIAIHKNDGYRYSYEETRK